MESVFGSSETNSRKKWLDLVAYSWRYYESKLLALAASVGVPHHALQIRRCTTDCTTVSTGIQSHSESALLRHYRSSDTTAS